MADISKIKINNVGYNIKDATARANFSTLTGNKFGYADYRTVTESGTSKHYIYFYKDQASAPASNVVPSASDYLCRIDAADFVKDGMVSNVQVVNAESDPEKTPRMVLRITFNTDAAHSPNPIDIPVTDIFNPQGYLKENTDIHVNNIYADSVDVNGTTIRTAGDEEDSEYLYIVQERPQPEGEATTAIPIGAELATSTDIDNLQTQINTIVSDGAGVTDVGYNVVSNEKTIQFYDQSGWHDVASASAIVGDGGGVKGVRMNNSDVSKNTTTKVVDLGTVVTGIKINNTTDATVTNGIAAVTIPSAAWADVKPSGGVLKDDLATGVQTSLGKADSAIQGVKVNGTELTPDPDKKVSFSAVTGLQFDGSTHVGVVQLPEYVKKSDYDTTIEDIYQSIPSDLADLADDETHRVVTDAEKRTWSGKQNALTFDNVPTKLSANPVKSGGVYSALADLYDGYDSTTETLSFTFPTE